MGSEMGYRPPSPMKIRENLALLNPQLADAIEKNIRCYQCGGKMRFSDGVSPGERGFRGFVCVVKDCSGSVSLMEVVEVYRELEEKRKSEEAVEGLTQGKRKITP